MDSKIKPTNKISTNLKMVKLNKNGRIKLTKSNLKVIINKSVFYKSSNRIQAFI